MPHHCIQIQLFFNLPLKKIISFLFIIANTYVNQTLVHIFLKINALLFIYEQYVNLGCYKPRQLRHHNQATYSLFLNENFSYNFGTFMVKSLKNRKKIRIISLKDNHNSVCLSVSSSLS